MKRKDLNTDEEIDEEIIADQLEDVMKRAGFLKDIGRKDQSLIERVIAWLQDMMSKFREYFRNPQGKLTRDQAQRMANELGRMAREIVNQKGEKIFRHNTKTNTIQLATGESLENLYESSERETKESAKAAQTKKALVELARTAWNDKNFNGKVSFTPSKKFRDKAQEIFGHDVTEVFITAGDIRHIKKHHGENEEKRGQVDMTPDDIAGIYDIVNDFSSAKRERDDKDGNKAISVTSKDGLGYTLLIERGKRKAQVRTSFKWKKAQVLNVTSPEPNVRNDPVLSSAGNIPQAEHEHNAALVREFGGRIENGEPVFDNTRDEAEYYQHLEDLNSGKIKYSVANTGANSTGNTSATEKLKTKLKNLLTVTKNERTHNRMRKLLEELSGYRIRTGRFSKAVDKPDNDVAKVIRSSRAYDWDTILPAVGKLVAQRLNLDTSKEMSDCIANWLVDGINDNSPEAQAFQAAMRNADDYYRNKILEVRELFDEWNKRPPEQKVRDSRTNGTPEKPLSDKAKGFFDGAYEQFVEELYPIKQLVDDFEEELGRKLKPEEDPYVLLRNYRGMAGRAKIMVEGNASAIDALKTSLPNVNFDGFKTVRMILESIGAHENEEKRNQFSDYLLACAIKDLHNINNAIRQQQTQLERSIERLEDALEDLKTREEKSKAKKLIKERKALLEALKLEIYATPKDMTEEVCDATIAKYKKDFGAAQQDMQKFQTTLLDIMVDSGILSKDSRDDYLKRYPNHVPLFRAFDENENVTFGDSLKQMKGSTRDIIDPLESIIRNAYSFIRRAEKNKAKLALVNLSRVGGAGEIFDETSKPNGATHTSIPFFEDGKKKYLDTDRSIAKVVNNLAPMHMPWLLKFIRAGTMLLRNFVTVYNPAFALRNLAMDDQNAMLYSKYGIFSPADLVRGFLSVLNRDADFNEWMSMGGAQASFWSVDRDYTQSSIDTITKGKWKKYKSVKGFFKLFAVLGEYTELATRVGYYKKARKALAEQNGGKIDRSVLISAALESRDLTDFARGGESGRAWNTLAAFSNASIQGWDKFFRTFDPRKYWSKDKAERQEWQRAVFQLALWNILPAVLLFMFNHDEDWYEKDLPDWERQTHWCVGENIRIPKGQDVGARFFSNLTESILRSMAGDKKAFEHVAKPLYDSLPDFLPTAIQPIIECLFNYDWFRRSPIVSARERNLPEYMQYDSRTSALAKGIGDSSLVKFLVGETGLSPAKIDHFLYGYTGKMGKDFVRLGQNVLGKMFGKDEWADYNSWTDLPIINGIKSGFFRTPYTNPRILTEFYEKLDEQTKLHNEFKMTKKRPEGYNHNLYTRLKKTSDEMKKFAKKEREIIDDPNLDFDVRDERRQRLQKRRVDMAERALR